MLILPVIDAMNGLAVRGVGGRRDEYRPVTSVITRSALPLDVALAFRQEMKLSQMYLADLDSIVNHRANSALWRELSQSGFATWIDAGIDGVVSARCVAESGASRVIAGLESLSNRQLLADLVDEFGSDKIVFSLDLKNGLPFTDQLHWRHHSALEIAQTAFDCGVRQMIVLDLSSVGEQSGISTLSLCAAIRERCPGVFLLTGGGVRNSDDLLLLKRFPIDGVLLSTALHNGTIGAADLARLQ